MEKIGVSRQSVSKWETDSAIPDIEKLKLLAEFYRSVRCSENGKIYLKLKCVLVQDSAETQMTGLVKTDESDGNISVDMVKKENGYEGEAEIPVSYLVNPVNISQVI